ncbi:molybdenum cofactor guanylyltransferase [Erythrobacter insulae]|uniref:Molybdenum cofactor guanylyltransferase n=1 Tax=Erythrobacter insulae TaxID=2584124 RepID=A0A547PAB0_9SPHN|nr:molybdenum cofactor guanylyltransferase [Erythrobacter insulae]TRD11037.1 molybdenum cofactor guanylyltransferase [Erythrobacter insulae]
MKALPSTPICVLAGGSSERFGSNKALADLGGKPLISHVLDRVSRQSSGPIAINTNDRSDFSSFGLPIVEDRYCKGQGPLTGILTALRWASEANYGCVATIAVDLPFLPENFIHALSSATIPSIAMSGERWHPVNGLWNCSLHDDLRRHLASGRHSSHSWAENCNAEVVDFSTDSGLVDPFWNINTREDLALAARHF